MASPLRVSDEEALAARRPVIDPPPPDFKPFAKARKTRESEGLDPALRPHAAVLYRALERAGPAGVPWIACWEALVAAGVDTADIQVGRIVTWLRYKGVAILAYYEGGETRFRLEDELPVEVRKVSEGKRET